MFGGGDDASTKHRSVSPASSHASHSSYSRSSSYTPVNNSDVMPSQNPIIDPYSQPPPTYGRTAPVTQPFYEDAYNIPAFGTHGRSLVYYINKFVLSITLTILL